MGKTHLIVAAGSYARLLFPCILQFPFARL